MMMTAPGQTLGVSIFIDQIILDLDVSRSAVSLLYTIGTLAGALSLPFIGRFIDRWGPRVGVVVISALLARACLDMGLFNGLLMLLIGFVLIRALGQGALSLVSLHAGNIWFVRRRGLAVGTVGLGMAAVLPGAPRAVRPKADGRDTGPLPLKSSTTRRRRCGARVPSGCSPPAIFWSPCSAPHWSFTTTASWPAPGSSGSKPQLSSFPSRSPRRDRTCLGAC